MNTTADKRCGWCQSSEVYIRYHDNEWGRPCHDSQRLFEMINLEGAQAGLSWITILNKREGYRKNFAAFDPAEIAQFTDAKLDKFPRILPLCGIGRKCMPYEKMHRHYSN
jgi:DNA-3-methyladenine glycosylase I